MSKKRHHSIRNWPEYNRALIQRGDFSVWLPEERVKFWKAHKIKRLGRPRIYADAAIECALTIRAVYRLSLRAAQGLLRSLIRDLDLDIPCPDYTTLSRRSKSIRISAKLRKGGPIDLVFDASGLKVFGSGEWRQLRDMISKRRVWRKIHIGMDVATQEVVVLGLSTKETGDGQMLPSMLTAVGAEVSEVVCDGGYDTMACYRAIHSKGARAIIPPRKGARPHGSPELIDRDRAIDRIGRQRRGRRRWKREVGYHRRSLVETFFSRWKQILGADLRSRLWSTQKAECIIKAAIMNTMAELGLPDTDRMAA